MSSGMHDVASASGGPRAPMAGRMASVLLSMATIACAGGGADPTDGSPRAGAASTETVALPPDTARLAPGGTTGERLRSGDYAGVLSLYASDPALHDEEEATYHAAVAAAASGHPRHDPRLAADLFQRLLERHPETVHRADAEVYLQLLARQRELRATVQRLDRELKQLKAIDLGQQPEDPEP